MSRSSTASASKQLPTKSAWARGPPQPGNTPSPRSQSPAPSNVPPHVQTHQRRSSQLSQGVGIKDGVSIPRGDALKQGSGVTFGTIRDAPAPISSSPVPAPAVAAAGSVKTFGSVPVNGDTKPTASASTSSSSRISSTPTASTSTASSTTPAASSTKSFKMDVAKLFQGSGSSSTPSAPSTSETQSPSVRSSNLPPQSSHQPPPQQHQGQSSQSGQPSQMSGHHFTPFVPGMRQQNGGPGGPGGVPRSPSYNRSMTNGNSSRPTGPNGPNGPSPIPPSMSSPRLQSHPHAGQPAPMAPPPQMQWPPYPYYPPYDYGYMYMPQQMPPPPNSLGPPQPGMAMSPRTGPIPLQSPTPGTPTPPHAVPHIPHAPHPPPLSHTSSSSISGTPSTPTTPSTGNIPLSAARLNMGAASFVPNSGRGPTKISIKNPNDGAEIKIENWKKGSPGPGPSPASSTPPPTTFNSPGNRQPIRLESEDARKKRIAEEEEKQRKVKEAEQAKREAEETAKREKERKEKEDKERKEKEEEERRKKEEEKEKELKRLEEEKIRKEQEERERKAKEEKEREEERLRLEEEERARKLEEAERKRKEEEDRLLKEKEEKERAEREAEEKAKAQAEAEEKAKVEATAKQAAVEEPEEGEVVEADAPVLNGIPKPREKESLRIDTADSGRKRPGPLNLTIAKGVPISAAPMSALATARRIEDLGSVQYPEGIKSPSTELNANAQDSKFRYDRDFLLQFMKICTEKPDMLPPLDAIGLQPSDQISYSMTRGGSGRHRQSSGPVSVSRQASTGPNFNQLSGFNKASPVNTFTMGQFATPGAAKMSSEDRFAMSSRSASGPAGMAFGRPAQMQRTASQGGPGPMNKQRTRSKRGEDRGGNKANSGSQHSHGSNYNNSGAMAQSSLGLEPVVPLQQSANRWDRKALAADPDSPEIVDRKVKGLLNKLTMEKFDSISDQIIEWANRSEKEKDGRTLIQVIRLVFEKATDEATWSEMYARLCRKMMEQISPKVQDDGIKNAEGKPITGGHLFRKYLLNRCQEDFERGWVAKEATAAAAASKALEDKAAKAANDKAKENAKEGESTDEVALYSDEYYAAQKAKRQGLGLIKFIGELFKLQMLTERIMHECVKKLLGNVDNPEEEEIESLCKLLSTVGQLLDTPKARAHMDVYFSRMKDLIKSPHVSSRMQFMLQDVIELRERRWVSRNQVAAPTTLAAVHEAAAKEKASAEKEALQKQQLSMSRGGSRRGGERNELTGPDGWTTRPPSKAGDLSQFGKISKPATMNFGPSSVFANKKGIEKKEPISRTGSSSNMFSMLSGNPGVAMSESGASKSSRPPSRKASIDLSQSGAPDGQRRRLNLPRTKPVEEVEAGPSQEGESEEGEEVEAPTMSDADAKKKIDEDVKEFFGVRNLDEAEVYFSGLPSTHHERLVDKLVSKAIESKEADATLVADFFTRAASKSLCSPTSFEEGFFGIAEFLEDIAIDAPKAWDFMALMVKGASLNGDNHGRIASKTTDAANLLRLLSSPKAVVSLSPFKAVPDGQLPPLPPVGPFPSRLSPHEATSSLSPHIPTPLSVDDNGDASSASPSSLAAARPIVNLGSVQYPNGIQGPNLELNINAWGGKFRYDREFLLQFMKICTFRPDSLPPLDAIGIQSYGQALYSEQMTWGGSFRSQKPDAFRPISGFSRRGPITTPLAGAKTSSDNGIRGNSVDPGSQGISGYKDSSASVGPSLGHNIVAPLQQSANRWDRKGGDPVERKVRGLLNKLTKKTFNSVSNQIVVWADEFHDGHDHTQLVQMICETLDDRLWLTRLFARMCEKMQRNMAPTASQAFRESLFQRCMADFKRHWAFEDGMEKNDPKAKRQTLGLLSFIGQLFNLQILKMGWQAIIFCIETLLEEVEERKLEGLCALLAAAGEIINERRCPPPPESRGRIGACFARIENLPLSGNISFRMKFKLKDVLKYREWHCPWIISADDSDEDYSDEVIMVKSSVTKSKSVAPSHKPNIDTFRARTPQEEAWRLKLLQDLLDEVEEHEERGAMDQEEATKKIIHDVDEFFVIRHPDAAASEAYFAELPTMYHQQLVNQLVSRAIEFESDEVSTMMLADLFNRVASKKLCSPLAFEEGFRVFVRSLKDIAIDIPKAWWFMDTIVDGVCWNEGYERQRIVPYQMQKYYQQLVLQYTFSFSLN